MNSLQNFKRHNNMSIHNVTLSSTTWTKPVNVFLRPFLSVFCTRLTKPHVTASTIWTITCNTGFTVVFWFIW